MAEATSGTLAVLVMDEEETRAVAKALAYLLSFASIGADVDTVVLGSVLGALGEAE